MQRLCAGCTTLVRARPFRRRAARRTVQHLAHAAKEPTMPLVTLTVHDTTPAATRRLLLDAVHAALVAVGVPPSDRFQRVVALPPGDLIVDAQYPDTRGRVERFALVEVLWSVGRSVKLKPQLLQHLV